MDMAMIREKALLHKLKNESPDINLFHQARNGFRPSKTRCPYCGSCLGGRTSIRSYPRMMITVVDGKRVEEEVQIPLYQCPSCGHSHALLPDVLIPFGSYTLRFILTVLKAYLERTCTVRELCARWQIAVSTLYGWIHCFAAHFSIWRSILFRISWVTKQALKQVEGEDSFPSAFFSQFGFSFLQMRSASHSAPVAERPGGT